jgi:hypothetical protein
MKPVFKSIAVACLFFFVSNVQAQFSIGPKFGLNMSTLSVDPDPYQGSTTITKGGRMNILFAAQAQMLFGKMFGVQIEPGYTSKSARWEDNQGGKRTISVSEIQIPILFLVTFMQGTIEPFAFVGPNLGIVASASDKTETQGGTQDVDIKANVSGLDFALDFGGGTKFKIANKIALTGDIRYSLGMSNLDARQIPAGVTAPSTKSRGFQIQFGALFSI